MTEKLQQTIKEELAQLPKEGQDVINSVDWVKIAEEIGKKFQLEESEVEDFQLETLLVLIGAVDSEFYAINIENHVNTTKDTATKMADEGFQKIFFLIKNILEENIKKNMKDKNPSPEQTLNFILSGGDYSAFIEQRENQAPNETPATNSTHVTLATPPTLEEIKNKLTIKQ